MPDLSQRSEAIEIMDDLACSGPVVDQALIELEFINKWLGGNAVTLNGLNNLLPSCSSPIKVADLGCGGGDMLMLIADRLRKKKYDAQLTGIDANPNIVSYAQKNATNYPEISFKTLDVFSDAFRQKKFDLVFATLFFHHFTRGQLIDLFAHLTKSTRCGIVVNDLHRHGLAYYSIMLLTKIFSKSSMVVNDAPLSVHRGFKRAELVEILKTAGITTYSLKWKWAFRWQLIIRTENSLA
jgi:2-polyprenyl-3-methyl-5-hydroxy-6-metoxy-1,4-benzoquinol methylase